MIVGFTGKKGSGKDTAGAYLVKEFGYVRLSFADALKQSAAALFDVRIEVWDALKNDPNAFVTLTAPHMFIDTIKQLTVREFLQRYGTEAHRDVFGEDFWIDVVRKQIVHEQLAPKPTNIVITDARFDNEAAVVVNSGGVMVEIVRDAVADSGDTHASEQLPHTDFKIDNNGTIEDLHAEIDKHVLGITQSQGGIDD